jgi:hypothetical protein
MHQLRTYPRRGTSEDHDLKQLTGSNLDTHDWDARASEALANAKKLPPGSLRNDAINKAGQLRIAADMKKLIASKRPAKLSKIPASAETPRRPNSLNSQE